MRHASWSATLLAAALLAGCSAEHEELGEWMERERREVKPKVPPLQAPKRFDPQPYQSALALSLIHI